jgi:heme o synthase
MMNTCNGCKKSSLTHRLSAALVTVCLPVIDRMIPWLQLTKLPVCLLVAFSAMFGSVVAGDAYMPRIALTTLGVLFLASGSATLNSLQEIHLDASMSRTKNRPLPRGVISAGKALVLSLLLIVAGLLLLFLGSHVLRTVELGFMAVVLYNLIYTPLKARTVAAIIPGALSGALPPYIGWSAAGGDPFSGTALLLCILFILWQVPHSLLILLNHRADYLVNDTPSLVKFFPESSLNRIVFVWIGAFFIAQLLMTGIPLGFSDGARSILRGSVLAMFLFFCTQLPYKTRPDYHFLFILLNFCLFLTMAILSGDRLFFC